MSRLLAFFPCLVLWCAPAMAQQPPHPPHSVLVVVLDDVGAVDIGARTPTINDLATRAVVFSRAYAFPVCSPSRAALLTGRYPRRAGIGDVVDAHDPLSSPSPALPRSDLTLAEALKPAGLATCLIGKWHLGRAGLLGQLDTPESGPFAQGFDHWLAGSPTSVAEGPGSSGYFDWYRVDEGEVFTSHRTYATRAQREAFESWWTGTPGPKFAWVAFNAAHAPYDTPPGYVDEPNLNKVRKVFLNVLEYADTALASMLASVDLQSTYVIIVGDNGTPDAARPVGSPSGVWKGTTYEGGIRVPLLLLGPGLTPGTSSRLVSVADLPATVCELMGVPATFADSRSMLSGPPRDWVFSERYYEPVGLLPGYDDQAVIERAWKLRLWDRDGSGPAAPEEALYHLPTDPFERNPLDPASFPSIRARLHGDLASLPPRS